MGYLHDYRSDFSVQLLDLLHTHPLPAALIVLAVAGLLLVSLMGGGGPRYSSKAPLTKSEVRFFRLLEKAAPDFYIFPQVGMSAFLDPPDGKDRMRYFAKISQKRVDFLLCDKKHINPVLIVELDDWSHDGQEQRDAARDAMPGSAGIRTIRFRWGKGLTVNVIRSAIMENAR